MKKKFRGFTLIELLLVVAVIGILVILTVPHAVRAVHKAKQRGTMREIQSISTVLTDYLTDHGLVQDHNGTFSIGDAFYSSIAPHYIPVLPTTDNWNNPYHIYGRANCNNKYGITGAADLDYVVCSLGHDNQSESGNDYVTNPGSGLYAIVGVESFNYDLVVWNGDWIRAPQTRMGKSGS